MPGESTFLYKVCQTSYDLPAEFPNDDGKCKPKRSAYLIQNEACQYSFGHPSFSSMRKENAETGETNLNKFTLTFTSDEATCDEAPFTMKVVGQCVPGEAADKWSTESINKCDVALKFKSSKACLPEVHLGEAISAVGKFVGVILIVNGVAMTFFGSKYLFFALSSLIFFGTFGVIMGVGVNLGFITQTSPKGLIVGVGIGALIVGALVSYFTYALAQSYAAAIISGAVGVCIAIIATGKVKNQMVKSVIIVLAAGFGVYLGK